jgi:ribose transport system permease protein
MTVGAKTEVNDARGGAARAKRLRARYSIRRQRIGVWLMTAAIALFLALAAPHFYSPGNIGAAGMTVLIMAGAFDLSVTSIVGLAPIVAITLVRDSSGPLAVLISIIAGALLGLFNGLIITLGHVAPFVATLGTLFVFGSIGAIITGGDALNIANDFLLELGTGSLFHFLPYSVLLMAFAFGVAYVVLRWLHVGRWLRAAGSNLRAAHVSGIDLHWVYLFIFVLSGALSGLAGILISGYLASADVTQAQTTI